MIYRILIAILLTPFWLLLSVVMTVMYAVGYIQGFKNVIDFYDVPKKHHVTSTYNEYDEFNINAN